jgi:hypothetical protein
MFCTAFVIAVVAFGAEGQPFKTFQQQVDQLTIQSQNTQLTPGQREQRVIRETKGFRESRESTVALGSKDQLESQTL